MMAYMSKDKNFMADYDQGRDVYMELAKQYRPDLPEDELRRRYRGKCKTLILALHYGMATETLSHNLDMTLEETEKLQNAYFSRYSSAKAFIDRKKKYCKEHGEIETIFGDRITVSASKYATAGINYVLQNSASVLMQAGFFNMDYAIRQLGINLKPKSVIHDSNQNEIWVKDLPYVLRAYKRFFRTYIRQVYGVDFKYDLELLRTFRDHTVVNMDFDTGIMEFEEGPEADILYFEKYLTSFWNMELIEEGSKKEASDDLIRDFCNMIDIGKKPHLFCMDPMIRRSCPMVYGRKWRFKHDWANDEICKKMDSMPMDVVDLDDIFMLDHSLKVELNEGLPDHIPSKI